MCMGVLGKPVNGMTFLCKSGKLTSLVCAKDGTDRRALFASRPFEAGAKTTTQHVGQSSGEAFPIHNPLKLLQRLIRCHQTWLGNPLQMDADWRVKRTTTSGYGWGSFPSIGSCHYIHPAWSTVEPSSRW